VGTTTVHFAVSCEQSRACPEYPGPEYHPLSPSAAGCVLLFSSPENEK